MPMTAMTKWRTNPSWRQTEKMSEWSAEASYRFSYRLHKQRSSYQKKSIGWEYQLSHFSSCDLPAGQCDLKFVLANMAFKQTG